VADDAGLVATSSHPTPHRIGYDQRLEHELDLVEGAIVMVSNGDASRVSLVVSHGVLILPIAQASGRQWGVIVRAVWHPDGAGCDLVVEPIG
jgi:hypothetical protein